MPLNQKQDGYPPLTDGMEKTDGNASFPAVSIHWHPISLIAFIWSLGSGVEVIFCMIFILQKIYLSDFPLPGFHSAKSLQASRKMLFLLIADLIIEMISHSYYSHTCFSPVLHQVFLVFTAHLLQIGLVSSPDLPARNRSVPGLSDDLRMSHSYGILRQFNLGIPLSACIKVRRYPVRRSPTPIRYLIASIACKEPMTPPIAPMTPACLQVGTASLGGGFLNTQR